MAGASGSVNCPTAQPSTRTSQPLDTGASSTRCMSIKAMKYTFSPAPETIQATDRKRAGQNLLPGTVAWLRHHVLAIVAVSAALAGGIVGIAYYWTFARFFVSTPD